ncbi:MAG: hypothetical protein CMF74_13705 [Maricaulis sp.]|nr:hypothetical protein [Maricaulis sp.]
MTQTAWAVMEREHQIILTECILVPRAGACSLADLRWTFPAHLGLLDPTTVDLIPIQQDSELGGGEKRQQSALLIFATFYKQQPQLILYSPVHCSLVLSETTKRLIKLFRLPVVAQTTSGLTTTVQLFPRDMQMTTQLPQMFIRWLV